MSEYLMHIAVVRRERVNQDTKSVMHQKVWRVTWRSWVLLTFPGQVVGSYPGDLGGREPGSLRRDVSPGCFLGDNEGEE